MTSEHRDEIPFGLVLPDVQEMSKVPVGITLHARAFGGGAVPGRLAVEEHITGAALTVSRGSMPATFLMSPKKRPQVIGGMLPALSVQESFDPSDKKAIMHPVVDFIRWTLDPVDARSLAPYVLKAPVADGQPPHLLSLAGRYDVDNPIEDVHRLLGDFTRSVVDGNSANPQR